MSSLHGLKCEACRTGSPQATAEEREAWLRDLPDWQVVETDGIERLQRVFRCTDFVDALAFTNRVGAAAEEQDHHPSLLTEWGRVTVTWWTHKIKGLHRNDFIMATVTDALWTQRST
jgi:4a-hydroxytetrahydrobiopterin dehydratase